MRMVVEIHGHVDARDPAKHDDRRRDECGHRPEAVDMRTLRMKVYPKRAAVSQQRDSVEDETMRVGLVAQDPFSAHRPLSSRGPSNWTACQCQPFSQHAQWMATANLCRLKPT